MMDIWVRKVRTSHNCRPSISYSSNRFECNHSSSVSVEFHSRMQYLRRNQAATNYERFYMQFINHANTQI
jgi:hypothetical protein